MQATRRDVLVGIAAAGLATGPGCAEVGTTLTPETFGAKGDGRTNDTDAFAALSAHVNAKGGGTIALRPVTYVVGKQTRSNAPDAQYAFAPAPILSFIGCTGAVVVRGNGARLRAAPGLRYGVFDPRSGRPKENAVARMNAGQKASPYEGMIRAESCKGLVEISDIELDGNLPAHQIGGRSSEKIGWQFAASGIQLIGNSGPQRLSRIRSHHHPLDGITVYRPLELTALVSFADVVCEYNGRQGCSITGGQNYAFERCRFLRTGKGGLRSPPSSGVDIEAGRYPIRNVSFSQCEFSDNSGPGLVAQAGDVEGVTFDGCTFVGTTSRSAWPNKPRMRFTNCLFVGSLIHAYGDNDPKQAAQFHSCRFSDDPALSATGEVFFGKNGGGPIAVLPNNPNVLFNSCKFDLRYDCMLPTSTNSVIYADCEMSQRSPARARTRGTFLGVDRINGNVDIAGSIIRGQVILNGRALPRNV